ncbi:MAG: amino acid permease [Saprospiraceae bacterium]|nr:amino acid permease [Saprospiraceae bacterium]
MKKFERSLSLPYIVAIAIGGMLGSGLFVLPGLAAAKTGPSIWIAYLLAAICVLPAAMSKAEMATAMPSSGGTYIYIERTFGPMMGTISGLGLWLSLLLKSSFALVGFGAYLLILADVNIKVAALVSLALITFLNIWGVKKVGKAQLFVLILSLTGLTLLVIMSFATWEVDLMRPMVKHGTSGLLSATAFVFVSYAGVTKVAAIAGEIKNPGRDLPLAMIIALTGVTAIYVLVTFVMVGNVPVDNLRNDIHPIYTLATTTGGYAVGIAAAILGVITLMSMANSGVLAASRFPFAMSRDALLPKVLGNVHPRYLTPTVTIVATSLVMALTIIFLDVEKIAKLASAFMVTMFIMVNACVVVLRETSVHWYQPKYKSPLYPFIQLFGIISGLILLFLLGIIPLLAVIAIFLLGALAFFMYGRSRSQRKGVLRLYGHRPALTLMYRKQPVPEDVLAAERSPMEGEELKSLERLMANDAEVVVALFGKEHSSEMIVEMGLALAGKSKTQVVYLTEVPEQTALDAVRDDGLAVKSIERRINAIAEEKEVDFCFDSIATHEVVETMHTISNQTHCEWIVMGWEGRARNGLLVRNPTGWLTTHLNSHFALYKDNGVRYIRRILVCLRPGREDKVFIQVADRIAASNGGEFTFLRVIREDADTEFQKKLRSDSEKLLENVTSKCQVEIMLRDNAVDGILEAAIGYDLLITGTPVNEDILKILFGAGKDKFAEDAPCSVLRLTVKNLK